MFGKFDIEFADGEFIPDTLEISTLINRNCISTYGL